jgi:putative endonuclease
MFLLDWWRRVLPFGRQSEIDGAAYLRSIGFRVIGSGYRTRAGEIDLIAWDNDVLVFVEVKALRSGAPPENAVGFRKQRRIQRAASAYLTHYRLIDVTYRFDILAVREQAGKKPEFRLLRNAFKRVSGSDHSIP